LLIGLLPQPLSAKGANGRRLPNNFLRSFRLLFSECGEYSAFVAP
jgi:hypothetical protein